MTDDERGVEKRKLNGEKVKVQSWVMVVTYILCWTFAAVIITFEFSGIGVYRPLLICLAIYLVLWPVFQVSPVEMIRRIFPGGSD